MALLKEDGSLDIERINNLPFEEYMNTMGDLTQEQVKEYLSKLPINESNEPMRAIKVDSTFDMGVNADMVINNLRNICKKKQ
jgi:hypothetical protein